SFAVTSLTLIDADNGQSMGSISDGQVLDLDGDNLSIRAETSGTVESVVFTIGNNTLQTESNAPYAIAGDSGGNYTPWDYNSGTYTLVATPYSDNGGNGDAGQAYSIEISIGSAPTVNINYNCDDTSCNFWNSFTDDGWATATHWDFGDGTTATSNGSHTFGYGDFTVTLTMTDNDGLTGTDTLQLSFEDLPDPEMYISNLDAEGQLRNSGNNWRMRVWVYVVDENGDPVQNATIGANFDNGGGYKQCTTNNQGRCRLNSSNVSHDNVSEMTLTINNVWGGDNDPFNRDASAMTVTVERP
ncbi:MAG: PKD domain-containing protein, partial [Chloroflexota bacterium]